MSWQVQATVVGLLAALASLLLGAVSREELNWAKVALLCTSSVITAFLAALALGEPCPMCPQAETHFSAVLLRFPER